jgi:hypothetical protein
MPVDKFALTAEEQKKNMSPSTRTRRPLEVGRTITEAMMKKDETSDRVIFLESLSMDRAADYMQRGARFAPLSDADLVAKWLAGLRAMADAPLDRTCQAEIADLEAEMNLRNIEPPFAQGQPELERWMVAAQIAIAELRGDPAKLDELTARVLADLLRFDGQNLNRH